MSAYLDKRPNKKKCAPPKGSFAVRWQRWLTPDAKVECLADWEAVKARFGTSEEKPGKGYPDPAIMPLVDALNEIEGVCTLQSCQGHDGEPGHLWLWLSEEVSKRFDESAIHLAALPGVERVSRLYQSYGMEVTEIKFHLGSTGDSFANYFRALSDG